MSTTFSVVAERLVYDRALTRRTIHAVQLYLFRKYDIPMSLGFRLRGVWYAVWPPTS